VATGIDAAAERPHLVAVNNEAVPEVQATGTGPAVIAQASQTFTQAAAPSAQAQAAQPAAYAAPAQSAAPQAFQAAPAGGQVNAPAANSVPGQANAPHPQAAPPASRHANLFTEPPRTAETPAHDPNARSLFGRVTGAFRRSPAHDERQEPAVQSHPTINPADQNNGARPVEGETGLEIPAFLRR
jgi:cell division protein FtsZ